MNAVRWRFIPGRGWQVRLYINSARTYSFGSIRTLGRAGEALAFISNTFPELRKTHA